MNTDELYSAVDRSTSFSICIYDEHDVESGIYYLTSGHRLFFNNLNGVRTELNSLAELVDYLKKDFSTGVQRFTVYMELKDSLVDTRFDSSDGIAVFSRLGDHPAPVRAERNVIIDVANLLSANLNVALPGPILTRTTTRESQL